VLFIVVDYEEVERRHKVIRQLQEFERRSNVVLQNVSVDEYAKAMRLDMKLVEQVAGAM
jgi:hypothetical protein